MPREAFPSLPDFLAGMEPGTTDYAGTTENWDVVVSYSLDKLNHLLESLWTEDGPFKVLDLSLQTKVRDPRGGKAHPTYNLNWGVSLGSPTLSFNAYGNAPTAVLTMVVNGWSKAEDRKDAKGIVVETYDAVTFEKDTFVFKAAVPVAMVRAERKASGDIDVVATIGAEKVVFMDKPGSTTYVVLDFHNDQIGTKYIIETKESSAVVDNDMLSMCGELGNYLGQTINMPSIKCALAEVTAEPATVAYGLTPQKCAFSIYAPDVEDKNNVGCLSVYIKAKETSFADGNPHRSFKFPKTNAETYPIPFPYTASIIVRHQVFAQYFFEKALTSLTITDTFDGTTSTRKFFNKVIETSSTSGLAFNCFINASATGHYDDKGWFGGMTAEHTTFNFGDNPVKLTLDSSNAKWTYDYWGKILWNESFRALNPLAGGGDHSNGSVSYHLTLDKSQALFKAADDKSVQAHVQLESKDWVRWKHGDDAGDKDNIYHKQAIPDVIGTSLDAITLPTMDQTAELKYFAATNVFAPGKHMIKVDNQSAVYLPYDLVILGHVEEPPEKPASTSQPAHAMAMGNFRPLSDGHSSLEGISVGMGVKVGNDIKSNDEFCKDMLAGKPILVETMKVLAMRDLEQLTHFVNGGSGYYIDTTASIQAAESNNEMRSIHFDVRQFGGLYEFTKPADLAGHSMIIDSANSRIYVSGDWVHNRTDHSGNVVFTFGKHEYTLRFGLVKDDRGDLSTCSFAGSRVETGTAYKEDVHGLRDQNLPSEATIASAPIGSNPAYTLGIHGFSWLTAIHSLSKTLLVQDATATEAIAKKQKALDHAVTVLEAHIVYPTTTLEDFTPSMQTHNQTKLRAEIGKAANDRPAEERLRSLAATHARQYVESGYISKLEPYYRARMRAVEGVVGADEQSARAQNWVKSVMAQHVEVLDNLTPDSAYIEAIVSEEIGKAAV